MSSIPAFARIRVGQPLRHEALTVFPLFTTAPQGEDVDYLLSDEAVADGTVVVEEVDAAGSVPTLLVTNKSSRRVLFLEGEELRGAKQNRVLNTTVLVAARSKVTIPVSCVERGRWHLQSKHFHSSDTYSSSRMRKSLKKSVSESLRGGHGHRSDQGAVWSEVTRMMDSLDSSSETDAMAAAYEDHRESIEDFRLHLAYVDGATGLAVAVGPVVVALDLYDKPATCQKVWNRLISGFTMDALEASRTEAPFDATTVERLLGQLRGDSWSETPAAGEGQEYRTEPAPQTHASALTFSSCLLHGSAVVDSPV